jgi:hypothetical protein
MAAIITADDIRAYMPQIADTDATDDLLVDIAARASDIVLNAASPLTFTPYPAEASFEVAWGNGSSWLLLPAHQAGSVEEVRSGSSTGTLLDDAGYEVQGSTLRLVDSTEWPAYYYNTRPWGMPRWGYGPYYVKAKWGYGPAPAALVQVALEVAINIYQTRESGGLREAASVEGGSIVQQVTGLSRRQREVIASIVSQYHSGAIA